MRGRALAVVGVLAAAGTMGVSPPAAADTGSQPVIITLQATPTVSTYGVTAVTVTATVTGESGTPTGTVEFEPGAPTSESPRIVDTTLSVHATGDGTASSSIGPMYLQSGTWPVIATYSGDGTYAGSESAQTSFQVDPAVVTSTISSSDPHPVFGQRLVVSTQSDPDVGGSNQLLVNGTPYSDFPIISGSAGWTFDPSFAAAPILQVGRTRLTAVRTSLDANFTDSSASMVQVVHKADTVPNVQQHGQQLTVTPAAAPPGAGQPTGFVSFGLGNHHSVSRQVIDGSAVLPRAFHRSHRRPVKVRYLGDENFRPSSVEVAP